MISSSNVGLVDTKVADGGSSNRVDLLEQWKREAVLI
jgi:hypothetical protein